MPILPDKMLTPEGEELERKKTRLAELESQLAERELELATFRADLVHFEKRYLQSIGRRYALLDELKANLAGAIARQQLHNHEARAQADEARATAQQSARAAGTEHPESALLEDAASPGKPRHPESLRNLYRQAARLLHPDLTLDGDEKEKRHRLMAELNDAYQRGDEDRIRAILRDWHASPDNVPGDGPGAELVRAIRKIAQAEKRLHAIAAELDQLREGQLFQLKQQVEEAHANGHDLLQDLAAQLDREIAQARQELQREKNKGTP